MSNAAPAASAAPAAFETTERASGSRIRTMVSREDLQPYMRLVQQAASRLIRRLPPNVLRDDLVAAGTYGLVDALRKHEGARGPEFEWYARVRIRGAMIDELRTQDWLPRSTRQKIEQSGSSVAPPAIVGFEDLPEDKRLVPPSDLESPLDLAERNSQRTALAAAVSKLPAREASIVEMHYFHGVQFKEIAASLNVSEPRVSQLHSRAMKMLRDILVPASGLAGGECRAASAF